MVKQGITSETSVAIEYQIDLISGITDENLKPEDFGLDSNICDVHKICTWSDSEGNSGLTYFLGLISFENNINETMVRIYLVLNKSELEWDHGPGSGDLNGSSVVNEEDCLLLRNYILNNASTQDEIANLYECDLNADLKIDIFDLIKLKKVYIN
jgi:hypothetical protein